MGGRAGVRRVLIVEDDPEMRRLLADFLREEGIGVAEAADVTEALRWVSEERFDGVILDKNLPDGSGLDLLPRLAARFPGLPVILITAFGDPWIRHEASARGASALLLKPFSLDDLLAAVRRGGVQESGARRRPGPSGASGGPAGKGEER
ncbi:MAG: response regulator [candidate division NC10 bacterium]|nr:response regulator [candidate division NC10 bacterium]